MNTIYFYSVQKRPQQSWYSTNLQKSMSCETRSSKRTRKGYLAQQMCAQNHTLRNVDQECAIQNHTSSNASNLANIVFPCDSKSEVMRVMCLSCHVIFSWCIWY